MAKEKIYFKKDMEMFLAIDIGNTNITIGIFDFVNGKTIANPKKTWRISTYKGQTADEYGIIFMDIFHYSGLEVKDIKAVAAASVVPALNNVFKDLVKKYFNKNLFFVNHINNGGLKVASGNIQEAGADRIADVVAAYSIYGGGCVIIDFGTATTFDCIDMKGRYMGGAIAPGPKISAQSLNLRTAQLPQVEMTKPAKTIGSSTVECIQSGLFFGYIGLIKEILERIKKEMKVKTIIATGGLANLMIKEIDGIKEIVPSLTLEGIRIIWERTKNKNKK